MADQPNEQLLSWLRVFAAHAYTGNAAVGELAAVVKQLADFAGALGNLAPRLVELAGDIEQGRIDLGPRGAEIEGDVPAVVSALDTIATVIGAMQLPRLVSGLQPAIEMIAEFERLLPRPN